MKKVLTFLLFVSLFYVCRCQEESIASVINSISTVILSPSISITESANVMPTPTSRSLISTAAFPEVTSLPVMSEVEISSLSIVAANLSDQFISGSDNCICDLLVDHCDLMCCCDQDCTSSELKVFGCTISELTTEVCINSDSVLWTSLTQCSCEDQSLLCIIREQDPTVLEYKKHAPVTDSEQFKKYLLNAIPEDGIAFQDQNTLPSFYRIDDPVFTVQNNTFLGLFTVPGQLNGFQCHDSNPIAYLRDEERICEKQTSLLNNITCASLSSLHIDGDVAIARVPNTSTTDRLPVIIASVTCSSTTGEVLPCILPVYDNGACSNALLEVRYVITHNGTGEITGAHINILLGTVEDSQKSYIQKYIINFQLDQEMPFVLERSGNPGYIRGQPVLAGSLTDTDSIDITVNSSLWFSVRESNSQCNADYPTRVVRFLENLVTTCLLSVTVTDLIEDCDSVKSRAYGILTPSPNLNYVGIFGDSNPLNLSEWVQLINTTVPSSAVVDQPERVGAICYGVPTFLRVNILFSFFGDYSNPQLSITGVEFSYYTEDIFKKSNERDTVTIYVKTFVTFLDVSSPPMKVLQTISDTVRKLPHDFLYPLFISDAAVAIMSLTQVLLICLSSITVSL